MYVKNLLVFKTMLLEYVLPSINLLQVLSLLKNDYHIANVKIQR